MIIIDKIKIYPNSRSIKMSNSTSFISKNEPIVSINMSHLKIPMEFANCLKGEVKSIKIEDINLLIEGKEI